MCSALSSTRSAVGDSGVVGVSLGVGAGDAVAVGVAGADAVGGGDGIGGSEVQPESSRAEARTTAVPAARFKMLMAGR
jgi:hypothetical protein